MRFLPEVRVSDSSTDSNQWPRPYWVDTQLYDDFWNWLAAKLPRRRSHGAALAAGDIYDFLAWIRETNRPPIADRIAQSSLDADAQAYAADHIGPDVSLMVGFRDRLLNLRDMLRDLQFENWARERNLMFQAFEEARPSSPSSSSSRATHTTDSSSSSLGPGPYDVDLLLYEDFWNWLTEKLPNSRSRSANHAADDMMDFLSWIRETNRPPMAPRIALPSLDTDIQAYVRAYIGSKAPTIAGFRNRLLNLRDMLRDFHRQVQSQNQAPTMEATFRRFEVGGPSSLPAVPTMPSDGPILVAGTQDNPAQRDFGPYVLPGWRGGVAPDSLIAELRESGLLPAWLRPQSVLINGMRYAALLWPGRAPVTPNNPQGENYILTPGYREFGPQPHPRDQIGPLPDIGESVGRDWIHGPRVADGLLISVLGEFGLLPTRQVPMTQFYIHRERYTAESGPDGRILVVHRLRLP
ncbi:hypothetical protein WN73_14200 [Bradyrhizobium sp. CCBAU 45394]|nr:hypothetical protein [Bradyrhizobium sp. CCBAU 45394]